VIRRIKIGPERAFDETKILPVTKIEKFSGGMIYVYSGRCRDIIMGVASVPVIRGAKFIK